MARSSRARSRPLRSLASSKHSKVKRRALSTRNTKAPLWPLCRPVRTQLNPNIIIIMAKTETKQTSQTPFIERNGDAKHWLGNPRWSRIPAIPERKRAQEVISDVEKAKAATLLEE